MVSQKKSGAGTTLGITGLSVWGGVLGEEYLTALKGTRKAKVFKEMQDDAVIGTLLDSMWMPLLAAEFVTTPAGETPQDKLNAEFLDQVMNDMTKYSWRQHVLDALSMMVWGWSVEEMVFKKRLGPDGSPPSQYSDGKIGLHILDPRGQETLHHWKMGEEFTVESMFQQDPNSGRLIEIGAWKLLHATFRSRKRSPEGSSPLRSLYRAWYTRKNLEVLEAIGAERDLAGLPVIYLPYGAVTADKTAAETLIRNLRQDEEAGIVIPAPPTPEANAQGWKFELLGSPGTKQFNVRQIIQDLNKIILMRFFAQFLMLGMETVGTQALVEGSQDFFSLALKSIQHELEETWNQQLVPLLFSMNPGMLTGASGLPQIDWAEPGSKDTAKIVAAAQAMVSAQLLTPDQSLEDFLRATVGFPERPAGVGEGPRNRPLAPGPLQGLMSYDWTEMPDGSWVVKPKGAKFQNPHGGEFRPGGGREPGGGGEPGDGGDVGTDDWRSKETDADKSAKKEWIDWRMPTQSKPDREQRAEEMRKIAAKDIPADHLGYLKVSMDTSDPVWKRARAPGLYDIQSQTIYTLQPGMFVHEVGHHVHSTLANDSTKGAVSSMFRASQASGLGFVSDYSKRDDREYFAEAYDLFVKDPNALKEKNNPLHSLLSRVFSEKGQGANWAKRERRSTRYQDSSGLIIESTDWKPVEPSFEPGLNMTVDTLIQAGVNVDWLSVVTGSANSQPDPSSVHIPTAIKKKRRDQCMNCSAAPTVEVLWAEGNARAWFCAKCYREWLGESETHQVVEERKVENGNVPERWSADNQVVFEVASYTEVAGIKGRRAATKVGRATNEYQGLLTAIYDNWAKKAQRAMLVAGEGKGLTKEVDKQLLALAKDLKAAAGKHIDEAVRLGLKGPLDKEAMKLVSKQVETNNKFVDESLIPRIREKIVSHLSDLEKKQEYQLDSIALLGLLESMRSEPTGYAGAFWSAIFLGAGLLRQRQDSERKDTGQKPRRVRWVLDPAAEHCKKSEFHYGCPDLAGEYESWSKLPTVPAGSVTCLSNCRCGIEVQNDTGGWDRVA